MFLINMKYLKFSKKKKVCSFAFLVKYILFMDFLVGTYLVYQTFKDLLTHFDEG